MGLICVAQCRHIDGEVTGGGSRSTALFLYAG